MLKRRIIPVELLLNGQLVKSMCFGDHRVVGDPVQSSKVYSDQDADELLLLNIGVGTSSFDQLVDFLRQVAKCCFVPLTVGGGIRSVEDANRLFAVGADKISVCSATFTDDELIRDLAKRFGSQAVVACIDVRRQADGSLILFSNRGSRPEINDLVTHVRNITEAGVGEVLIQSIDKDGTMLGYDRELVRQVVNMTNLPVIALGGAGNVIHLKDAFDEGAEAAACGSLFNFGDNNPLRTKSMLTNYGIPLKKI